jgi:hypothetical protein
VNYGLKIVHFVVGVQNFNKGIWAFALYQLFDLVRNQEVNDFGMQKHLYRKPLSIEIGKALVIVYHNVIWIGVKIVKVFSNLAC